MSKKKEVPVKNPANEVTELDKQLQVNFIYGLIIGFCIGIGFAKAMGIF